MHAETIARKTADLTRREAEELHHDAMARGLDRAALLTMREFAAPDEILRVTGLSRRQILVATDPDVPCPLPSHVLHRAVVAPQLAAEVEAA